MRIWLVCLIAAFTGAGLGAAEQAVPLVRDFPSDLVLTTAEFVPQLRTVGLNWRWPTPEEMEAKAPKDSEAAQEAKKEAEFWLRLCMNEQFVPDDVQERMVLLDEDIDRIVARYVVGDLALYWQQTRGAFAIVSRQVSAERATDLASMRRLVQESAARLFVGPVPSVSVPEEGFRSTEYGARGLVTAGRVAYRVTAGHTPTVDRQTDEALLGPFKLPFYGTTDGEWVYLGILPKALEREHQLGTRNATSYVLKPGDRIVINWFSADAAESASSR